RLHGGRNARGDQAEIQVPLRHHEHLPVEPADIRCKSHECGQCEAYRRRWSWSHSSESSRICNRAAGRHTIVSVPTGRPTTRHRAVTTMSSVPVYVAAAAFCTAAAVIVPPKPSVAVVSDVPTSRSSCAPSHATGVDHTPPICDAHVSDTGSDRPPAAVSSVGTFVNVTRMLWL